MQPFQTLPLYDLPDSQIESVSGSPDNQHWIFISQEEQRDPQLMDFLSKILASIAINLDTDVNLLALNPSQKVYVHKAIRQGGSEKSILCFGVPPADLGLSIRKLVYQKVRLDGHTFLFCDKLSTIQSDANKKRALWESLQSIKSDK